VEVEVEEEEEVEGVVDGATAEEGVEVPSSVALRGLSLSGLVCSMYCSQGAGQRQEGVGQ
jgi:hypothetical protein